MIANPVFFFDLFSKGRILSEVILTLSSVDRISELIFVFNSYKDE
jgi:hypothetical protein